MATLSGHNRRILGAGRASAWVPLSAADTVWSPTGPQAHKPPASLTTAGTDAASSTHQRAPNR
ncbi:hypothetical protein GCM10010339_57940 [Streptomyces alanosinicus]|uniref:Uncharacterized protein n=1 Tax=Streptomyces alanosinicus TaxID=68171 RepID=A0A918YME2_9ACTN|nr:hypothetical protein GCM10010339_57940 [Streptomyces alanosinicus]